MDTRGAEKKLRQAQFFLGHIEDASREIAHSDWEHLEFYYSACLTAAQSVYQVLKATGGAIFQELQKDWRGRLPEPERSRFGRMIGLRDNDVHRALTGAQRLPKYVREDHTRYGYATASRLLFGCTPRDAEVEEENPDGTKVRGPSLRGTVGLYIEQGARRVEASMACREFIAHLQSLLEAAKIAGGAGR